MSYWVVQPQPRGGLTTVRLELIFAESTFAFTGELELLLLKLDLTIQDRGPSPSLRRVQHLPLKAKMLIQQTLMLGARLSDLL